MKSLVSDSEITCNEIKDIPDNVPTNFINKKTKYKLDQYISQTFLLVTILLLIIFTIYNYCIKYRLKQDI